MNIKNLKKQIEQEIVKVNEKVAIYFNDLNGNIIDINSNEPFEAASCLKMFVLLELFKQVYFNNLNLDDKIIYNEEDYVEGSGILRYLTSGLELSIRDMSMLMMIVSDNIAANILIDYLKIDNINQTIKNLGLDNSVLHSKFDYSSNKLCTMTAKDYGYAFEKIVKKELYSSSISQQILDILVNQQSRQMLLPYKMNQCLINKYFKENNNKNGIIKYIANKSGKWQSVRNDGGIISTIYGEYILVILIKDFEDQNLLNDKVCNVGTKISELIFNEYINLKMNEKDT